MFGEKAIADESSVLLTVFSVPEPGGEKILEGCGQQLSLQERTARRMSPGRWRTWPARCLLCIYMPAIDRSLSDCRYVAGALTNSDRGGARCLLCIYMPAIDRFSLIAGMCPVR